MKITSVEATNVLAIKSINLKLSKAVTLICGRNGSLKSSIFDVVSMAVAQEPMRTVVLKKDYEQLIHDGSKAGGGLVMMNGDPDQAYGFNLPKGEFIEPESPEYRVSDSMRVALNGQNFAKMDEKQRLVFLRTLMKVRSNKETIVPMLLAAADCPEDKTADVFKLMSTGQFEDIPKAITGKIPLTMLRKIDEITAQLRAGFSAAEEYAKARALDAKRLWCSTTGKKAYGKIEADAWEAPMPDEPKGDAATLTAMIAQQDTAISTANQSLGAIKQAAAQAQSDAEQRAKLAEVPAKVKSLTEQLAAAEKEAAAYMPKVEALRKRAEGKARVGLVHDMMRLIVGEPSKTMTKERAIEHAKIMTAYEQEHGPLPDAGKVDLEAQAALPEHENGLQVLQNRAKNLKRDLDSATQAKGQYDALKPADEAVDASAELAEVQQLLTAAQEEKKRLQNLLLDIEATNKNRAEATQKNAAAKLHHADVAQWLLIADELAPTGIPGRLLAAALEPVNAMLEQSQVDTGWPPVVIRDDMQIMAGGRLYALQSESYRWRADAMIAQMVATLSGIKILMLDKCDVLDLPGRSELLVWIDTLVEVGDIESAMLFATLKECPKGLSDNFACYWVENGGIKEME